MELINETYIENEKDKQDLIEDNSEVVSKAKNLDADAIRQLKIIGSRGIKSESVLYIIETHDSRTALDIIRNSAEKRIKYKKMYHELVDSRYKKSLEDNDGIENK